MYIQGQKKPLVSGNVGEKKNLLPSDRKFVFFNGFSGDILFSLIVSLSFFYYFFYLLV